MSKIRKEAENGFYLSLQTNPNIIKYGFSCPTPTRLCISHFQLRVLQFRYLLSSSTLPFSGKPRSIPNNLFKYLLSLLWRETDRQIPQGDRINQVKYCSISYQQVSIKDDQSGDDGGAFGGIQFGNGQTQRAAVSSQPFSASDNPSLCLNNFLSHPRLLCILRVFLARFFLSFFAFTPFRLFLGSTSIYQSCFHVFFFIVVLIYYSHILNFCSVLFMSDYSNERVNQVFFWLFILQFYTCRMQNVVKFYS